MNRLIPLALALLSACQPTWGAFGDSTTPDPGPYALGGVAKWTVHLPDDRANDEAWTVVTDPPDAIGLAWQGTSQGSGRQGRTVGLQATFLTEGTVHTTLVAPSGREVFDWDLEVRPIAGVALSSISGVPWEDPGDSPVPVVRDHDLRLEFDLVDADGVPLHDESSFDTHIDQDDSHRLLACGLPWFVPGGHEACVRAVENTDHGPATLSVRSRGEILRSFTFVVHTLDDVDGIALSDLTPGARAGDGGFVAATPTVHDEPLGGVTALWSVDGIDVSYLTHEGGALQVDPGDGRHELMACAGLVEDSSAPTQRTTICATTQARGSMDWIALAQDCHCCGTVTPGVSGGAVGLLSLAALGRRVRKPRVTIR